MIVTCGAYIVYNGNMFIVLPTNSSVWSIPKGIANNGEAHEDAMYREVFEETNIDLHKIDHTLYDLGFIRYMSYMGEKYLHGYLSILMNDVTCDIFCRSTFRSGDGFYHEVNGFKFVPIDNAIKLISKPQSMLWDRNNKMISGVLKNEC